MEKQKGPGLSWKIVPVVGLLFGVIIPLGTFWGGKWVDSVLWFPLFPPFPFNFIVGPLFIVGGLSIALGSIYQLYRSGQGLPWGDLDEPAQSTQLVTTGLYAYTRNPMALGFLMSLSGIGWTAQSITAIVIIPLTVFLLLWVWLKRKEEPQLEQRFGQAYRTYKERTPLIIPRPWRRAKKHRDTGN